MTYLTSEEIVILVLDNLKSILSTMISDGKIDPFKMVTIGLIEKVEVKENTIFIDYSVSDSGVDYSDGDIIGRYSMDVKIILRNLIYKNQSYYDTMKENQSVLSAIRVELTKKENRDLGIAQVNYIYPQTSDLLDSEFSAGGNLLTVFSVGNYEVVYESI